MAKTKSTPKEKKVTAPKAPKVEKEAVYNLEVTVNNTVFKTKGGSIEECLTNFVESPLYPHGSKTKLFIKYGNGKKVLSRFWHTQPARRLLMTMAIKDSVKTILAEQLNRTLND